MSNTPNHGSNRKEHMNAITRTTSVAVLVALGLALAAGAAEPPKIELSRTAAAQKSGKVVYVGSGDSNARIIQAEKFQGSPESFTAEITCLAGDDKTPIQIGLKGGRIGRGGIVEATIQPAAGRVKEWKGAATVWAWPDAPGFTGGREQDLEKWQQDERQPVKTRPPPSPRVRLLHRR